MSMIFGRWEKVCCESCGEEFHVAHSEPRTVDGSLVCRDCEQYDRGYADGYKAGVRVAIRSCQETLMRAGEETEND